jgi:hypothetical protein
MTAPFLSETIFPGNWLRALRLMPGSYRRMRISSKAGAVYCGGDFLSETITKMPKNVS